ncbi:LamG-like jellyroll fold domain-containing protein [Burkholderia diffusa]|uniref:LamG-like jellyroll fold domain-containing protein n=1 Tax=Burkholderia diffusa TaxID=488732 RepID=UPI00158B1B46|nr:LamG-like jellyroll fold domain-containing protein [Burkholderia diffusa]
MMPAFTRYRPSGYAGVVLSDTPYAYYKLDETSGTVMHDSSGNGRNGTFSGSSAPASGIVTGSSTSRQFTGGYASASFNMVGWTACALEAWVNVPSAAGSGSPTSIIGSGSPNIGWDHPNSAFRDAMALYVGSWSSTPLGASNGVIVHVGLDWDGTTLRAYLNGSQVSSVAVSGSIGDVSPNSNSFVVAANQANGTGPLACTVGHAAFYHHSLSAARWAAHYAAGH